MHDIAIITVNYNMRDAILAMLKSAQKDIAISDLDIAVVIVDNASSDNLVRILKNQYPWVTVIEAGKNLGFGGGNNIGLNSVEAKYYFVLNPDTVFVQPNTLRRLYEYMERETKIGMIAPKLVNADGSLQYSCFRFPKFLDKPLRQLGFERVHIVKKRVDSFLMKDFDHKKARPVDWVLGSAMFVRAEALKKVGGFDERFFMYFEDCDWCRRFWEAHFPIYYVPEIIIAHAYSRGSAKTKGLFRSLMFNRLTREHVKSWLMYYKKWKTPRKQRSN